MAKLICKSLHLALYEFELADAEFIYELVNDPDWIKNIGDRNVNSLGDAENFVRKLQLSYIENGFGLYLVSEITTGVKVGMCGLVKRPELPDVDVGFAFLPKARGKKYAQESSRAVLECARAKGLRRLLGIVAPENLISAKVLEKIGMKFQKKAQVRPNEKELLIYEIEL